MKKCNKILSVLLCLVLATSFFSFAVFAEDPETPACDHVYNDTVVPPTCAEQGYTMHVCSKCGDYYMDTYTNPKGHNYGQGTEVRAATCTEEGLMERECSRCHGKETKTISVTPHVDEDEDGLCDVCNAKVEVKEIFSPFEWLKSFIRFIRELIASIFA